VLTQGNWISRCDDERDDETHGRGELPQLSREGRSRSGAGGDDVTEEKGGHVRSARGLEESPTPPQLITPSALSVLSCLE
jgi:hypothetical protein